MLAPAWIARIDHRLGWFSLFLRSRKHFRIMKFAAWTACVPLHLTAEQFLLR